jgi:formiminoglutamase
MSKYDLPHDPLWPREGDWPRPVAGQRADLVLVGIPTCRTSLSRTRADLTPDAVRESLRRYSGHSVSRDGTEQLVLDEALRMADAGNLADPDTPEDEAAAVERIGGLAEAADLVVALGGDNALTVPAALGAFGPDLGTAGLITFDAHHDLRDGVSNGSPVRRLVEAGLDPGRIVQVGIADFANSRAYRQRAAELGITVIHRDDLHERPLLEVLDQALEIAGSGGGPIHVDLDVDVCDRAVAPACPASVPGGISAYELRRAARLLAADPRVRSMDLAEVDASADADDGRTVRLAALCVLEAATGLAMRSAEK